MIGRGFEFIELIWIEGFTDAIEDSFGCEGSAKASSASASVTLWLISFAGFVAPSDFASKANLLCASLRRENFSSSGNLAEMSSSKASSFWLDGAASRALKGSPVAPLNGDGLGLATSCREPGFVGRPRRIGVISGMACRSSTTEAFEAPTTGGEVTFDSGDGRC